MSRTPHHLPSPPPPLPPPPPPPPPHAHHLKRFSLQPPPNSHHLPRRTSWPEASSTSHHHPLLLSNFASFPSPPPLEPCSSTPKINPDVVALDCWPVLHPKHKAAGKNVCCSDSHRAANSQTSASLSPDAPGVPFVDQVESSSHGSETKAFYKQRLLPKEPIAFAHSPIIEEPRPQSKNRGGWQRLPSYKEAEPRKFISVPSKFTASPPDTTVAASRYSVPVVMPKAEHHSRGDFQGSGSSSPAAASKRISQHGNKLEQIANDKSRRLYQQGMKEVQDRVESLSRKLKSMELEEVLYAPEVVSEIQAEGNKGNGGSAERNVNSIVFEKGKDASGNGEAILVRKMSRQTAGGGNIRAEEPVPFTSRNVPAGIVRRRMKRVAWKHRRGCIELELGCKRDTSDSLPSTSDVENGRDLNHEQPKDQQKSSGEFCPQSSEQIEQNQGRIRSEHGAATPKRNLRPTNLAGRQQNSGNFRRNIQQEVGEVGGVESKGAFASKESFECGDPKFNRGLHSSQRIAKAVQPEIRKSSSRVLGSELRNLPDSNGSLTDFSTSCCSPSTGDAQDDDKSLMINARDHASNCGDYQKIAAEETLADRLKRLRSLMVNPLSYGVMQIPISECLFQETVRIARSLLQVFSMSLIEVSEATIFEEYPEEQKDRCNTLQVIRIEWLPEAQFARANHNKFGIQAFINSTMFDQFENESFGVPVVEEWGPSQQPSRYVFQNNFQRLATLDPADAIDCRNECYDRTFHSFCCTKLQLMQEKIAWLTPWPHLLLQSFLQAMKYIWQAHLLTLASPHAIRIIRVRKLSEFDFSEMEIVEASLPGCEVEQFTNKVQFMLTPGFKLQGSVIKSEVYLMPKTGIE